MRTMKNSFDCLTGAIGDVDTRDSYALFSTVPHRFPSVTGMVSREEKKKRK